MEIMKIKFDSKTKQNIARMDQRKVKEEVDQTGHALTKLKIERSSTRLR